MSRAEINIWNRFQAAPTREDRQAQGFYFATCPDCRIIFSMKDAREQEEIEKRGCSVCRRGACEKGVA